MALRMQIAIDTVDPDRLVRFWSSALHYVVEPAPDGFATWRAYWLSKGESDDDSEGDWSDSIVDPEGVLPRVWFQKVPEVKAGKNRLHLDLGVGGGRDVPVAVRKELVDAEVSHLTALGATTLWAHVEPGSDHYAVTMGDPEGNEFCVH